jgi:Zn/Cd-binding protein ZinT
MKTKLIFILTIYCNLINSQDIKLLSFVIQSNYTKDCNFVTDCIDSLRYVDNTLLLTFYQKDDEKYIPERTLSYEMLVDTLNIDYYSRPIIKDTIIFNEEKKKNDTLKCMSSLSILMNNDFESGCKLYYFQFKGLRTSPKYIKYNNKYMSICPTTIVDYTIYKGDTINVINKNGFKNGKWIEFYDTGEMLKLLEYYDGHFIKGTFFSKDGKESRPCSDYMDVTITIDEKK